VYEKGLRRAVDRLKFHNRREYVPFFAEAMAQLAMQLFPRWQPAYLIPIPMHAKKKKERGFDQAQLLAEELGRRIRRNIEDSRARFIRPNSEDSRIRQPRFEVRSDILVRTRYTKASKQLDRTARKQNLRGAFAVRPGIRLSGAVVLIDDIYTTGTTMDEAARALRAAGAEYVYFLTASIVRGED
jgi:predicted amidophosphoribosyltransferase